MYYQPSFGSPKQVRIVSEIDETGFVHIQFVEHEDYVEFQAMGIGEIIDEMNEIARVPFVALSQENPLPPNNTDTVFNVQRRQRPRCRRRCRRVARPLH